MLRQKQTEILINAGLHETRAALLENSILQEVYIERQASAGIVGNIYKGKVVRVLPGMDAAFVDIGLEKNAFLHVKNIVASRQSLADKQSITDFVYQGQTLLVQILKEPLGNKGARLSTDISIPSRYVVFLPNASDIGVSTRIEDESTRQHIKACIEKFSMGLQGGYIARTAIEKTDAWALHSDIQYLHKIWQQIQDKAQSAPDSSLLYAGLPMHLRVLRDLVDESVVRIQVDSVAWVNEMNQFIQDFFPDNLGLVSYYGAERPIFDLYSVEDEIDKALRRKVTLKSGGHLMIDQTEAMTTIDVNTGKFVGAQNHAETIFKTNLEATKSIARQLRLRNLGGIIIIDFIDMLDTVHQQAVVDSLVEAMDAGYSRYTIEAMSSLGLLQMTRKRTRESLGHILCETCPACHGRGYVKTIETVANEVIREVIRESVQFKPQRIKIICAHEINYYLSEEAPDILADVEETLKIPITTKVDEYYAREQYDIAVY
ncbi:Rne/Rng family ribonuclease [Ostreibacterium oceani]|uniref:Ribonuclease G n=1 Tax=Ostreibacterium oceani TaxID=2654998 RepID=A0A6N7EVZ1_9GAMM|nr:Rne/Rng family ribonuclease [Ostreibacterium oceani]MPV86063.1 Rne/Rng family ribonuclease [Ostreibacterium oceani]